MSSLGKVWNHIFPPDGHSGSMHIDRTDGRVGTSAGVALMSSKPQAETTFKTMVAQSKNAEP